MSITTTTHLNFRGQARAALDHYAAVFGGEVTAFTFAQGGDERDTAEGAVAEQIKWGGVQATDGFAIMAFDVPPNRAYDAEEIARYWDGLIEDGTVRTELGPAGYAPLYGMVTDRFGVTWVLDVLPPYNG